MKLFRIKTFQLKRSYCYYNDKVYSLNNKKKVYYAKKCIEKLNLSCYFIEHKIKKKTEVRAIEKVSLS